MANDVAIDRGALDQAKLILDHAVGTYGAYAEDCWRRDTGIADPCGRTHLRVALENALGGLLMNVRGELDDALALSTEVQAVLDSFAELDASLGEGWDHGYVADLA